MKKNIGNYKLNRDTKSRKALFKSQIQAMILHESIETSFAKAMAVRPLFEKLITKAKSATVHELRQIQKVLQSGELLTKLVKEIAPRFKDVKGGYTKIIPVGARRGDNSKIVKLSLTKLKVTTPAVSEEKTTKPKSSSEALHIKRDSAREMSSDAKHSGRPKVEKVKTVKLAPSRAGRRGDK